MGYRKINGVVYEANPINAAAEVEKLTTLRDRLQAKIDALTDAINS